LIDYAIKLYAKGKKDSFLVISDATLELKFNQILKNAIAITQDSTKYVKIESPLITYKPDEKRIDSESGRLKIYDKTLHGEKLRTDISYKRLIVFKQDDSVGLRVILRELQE
jgi:hypothetical protein